MEDYPATLTAITSGEEAYPISYQWNIDAEYGNIAELDEKTGKSVKLVNTNKNHNTETVTVSVIASDGKKSGYAEKKITVKRLGSGSYPLGQNREVKVSWQYFFRKSTADTFEPFLYSQEPCDDINGTLYFKINDKGMFYKPKGVDIEGYIYYPSNSSTTTLVRYNADKIEPKPNKYILDNKVQLEKDSRATMPYSCFFSDNADVLINLLYGSSSEVGGCNALLFEDSMIKAYRRKDHEDEEGHSLFKGIQYPAFETTEENVLDKGKLLRKINDYFVCTITIETEFSDVEIDWPSELWGIDHFE
ncbi:MAG: hypothetical protein NC548_53700 [Lachnospiraceae bacterium]|nr:hypothetical protein [Lachnospiraceae bacterium]